MSILRKYKTLIKLWVLWIIVLIIIVIFGYLILHFIPCHIWNSFRKYKKSAFFGSYYGSVVSALLTLGGVGISLLVSCYQTNKAIKEADERSRSSSYEANARTDKILKESNNKLQREKINNLNIEIAVINYKTLNRLISHAQNLDIYFTRAFYSAHELEIFKPTMQSMYDAFTDEHNGNFVRKIITKDVHNIRISVDKYNIFNSAYAIQLRNLFSSNYQLKSEYDKLDTSLNNLDILMRKVSENLAQTIVQQASDKNIPKNIRHISSSMSRIVNRILPSIYNISFDFGKTLRTNIDNQSD